MSVDQISTSKADRCARVLFVHGVGGDAQETWQQKGDSTTFWPKWIGDELAGLDVYSASYDASPTRWFGSAMPISDVATEILGDLEAGGFGRHPLVLVGHSLGGLLIKEMLRIAHTCKRTQWNTIVKNTRGVVFIATPHNGSQLADYATKLGKLFNASVATKELTTTAEQIKQLRDWYRETIPGLNIDTYAFYERHLTNGFHVVPEASADPSMPPVRTIGVNADHFQICKPLNRKINVYANTKHFIERIIPELGSEFADQKFAPQNRTEQVVVELPPTALDALYDIQEKLQTRSQSEVIRRALHLYALCVNEKVQVVSREGESRVVIDV
ncbi:MAG TPA: alpha/beta fold hydrolase [Rhizomicrobium sp.]|nr:alpha/beta fold hydrolase [Rhizomicrobium sp.]